MEEQGPIHLHDLQIMNMYGMSKIENYLCFEITTIDISIMKFVHE